jgi:hypothetical protein
MAPEARRDDVSQTRPPLQGLLTSSLMLSIPVNDTELQRQILFEGCDPRDKCLYLGHPIEMACWIGSSDAAERHLGANDDGSADRRDMSNSLIAAVQTNNTEIVCSHGIHCTAGR